MAWRDEGGKDVNLPVRLEDTGDPVLVWCGRLLRNIELVDAGLACWVPGTFAVEPVDD